MANVMQIRGKVTAAMKALGSAADSVGLEPVSQGLARQRERLDSSRFVLALVGERLTGKSTVANALLGNPVLPVRAIPTTALVHEVRHAERPEVAVVGDDTEKPATVADLSAYSEGVDGLDRSALVRVGFPSQMLQDGVVLLDTPGTNDLSTLGAELTYGVLPDVDAVVVVLDATQPLRRSELDFLQHRLPQSAHERTLAVLNKADLLGVSELEEATGYAEKTLAKVLPSAPLFAVSAKRALERADEGFIALSKHLTDLLGSERLRLVLIRTVGEAVRLGESLRSHLRLRREASELEEAELEKRIARLESVAGGSRRVAHEACGRVDKRAEELCAESQSRLHEFSERFREALPREIDRAEEADLRRYLPFFLEDTLKGFAETEAARIEEALQTLALEALAELAEKGAAEAGELDLGPQAALRVDVDTTKYDIGVFAAGALGTIFLFRMPLVGILLLAGAPLLSHVLKGKVSGKVRDVAKTQALQAVRDATARLDEKLREAILEGASRVKEAVLSHGEEAASSAQLALEQALAQRRGAEIAPIPTDVVVAVESACEELKGLGEALTERG